MRSSLVSIALQFGFYSGSEFFVQLQSLGASTVKVLKDSGFGSGSALSDFHVTKL